MNVVDIHPEELIDKLAEGSLTSAERERLDAHLGQCSSCRFEIAVRADLAEDAPVFEERPHLTFAGGAAKERLAGPPPAPQLPLAVRARSRRRWPLVMLAAALVLCAGGAMGAVITGAVSGQWLHWSAPPKPAESSVRVAATKPPSKLKRAVVVPVEPAPLGAVAPVASVASAPTAVVVTSRSARAPVQARRAEAAPAPAESPRAAPAESPRAASAGAFSSSLPAAGATEVSAPRVDAASLFADANRARRDGNTDRAVGLYRALQSRYPSSSESELSRALLAQLLLDRGNPEAALAGFDRYLAEDTPVLSAEALVGRARALEQLGKSTQAAAAWRQVQSRFPGSVHARLAATRLAALGMR